MSMKVLFVVGGNSKGFGIAPLITAQGESLKNENVEVCYFQIVGKGFSGYIKNIGKLKRFLKKNAFDIIHAHYSFSGVIASLSFPKKPIVVSLLGSDTNSGGFLKKIILFFRKFFCWDVLIVKSEEMNKNIPFGNGIVIPNGVNLHHFKEKSKVECRNKLNWDPNKVHILFGANPERPEKNFYLATQSINLLKNNLIQLHFFENVQHCDVPTWLNGSDVVVLPSLWEGSPNVVKEAMACNCPVVATDVGDIRWLFGNLPGYFIADFTPENFSATLEKALEFVREHGRPCGRGRLIELGLSSETIAKKLVDIYENVIQNTRQFGQK